MNMTRPWDPYTIVSMVKTVVSFFPPAMQPTYLINIKRRPETSRAGDRPN